MSGSRRCSSVMVRARVSVCVCVWECDGRVVSLVERSRRRLLMIKPANMGVDVLCMLVSEIRLCESVTDSSTFV